MAARSCPGARRDHQGGQDGSYPLEQHQPGKHPVCTPIDLLLALFEQDICSLFNGLADSELLLGSLVHSVSPVLESLGVRNAHPNTGVRLSSAVPLVTKETIEERPALSPACPREVVMPPLKRSFPPASYSMVCPETSALKRSASTSSRSLMTATPGISAALRRRSVSSQPSGVPGGRTNRTTAVARLCRRVIITASSLIVARVHGHFGCPMTRIVGRPAV